MRGARAALCVCCRRSHCGAASGERAVAVAPQTPGRDGLGRRPLTCAVVAVAYADRTGRYRCALSSGRPRQAARRGLRPESLTNTYAIQPGATITSSDRRGPGAAAHRRSRWPRSPRGWQWIHSRASVAVEIEPTVRSFILVKCRRRPISLRAQHDAEARGDCRRFSPRARKDRVTVTHTDASGTSRVIMRGHTDQSGDTVLVGSAGSDPCLSS